MTSRFTTAPAAITHEALAHIEGWLAWADFEIMRRLTIEQNDSGGAIAEVGVHHGKSFVALAAFSGDRPLYAIDLFGDQAGNIDQSGAGSRERFLNNLDRFGIDQRRITIDARLSAAVTGSDIREAVGAVSFFHVDGGHHVAAVTADIDLALAALSEDGIIAFDDTFRPEWPEVSMAVFGHGRLNRDFRMFAIGFNKSFWCRPEQVARYRDALLDDHDLSPFLMKQHAVDGRNILVFQAYPLPEWPLRRQLSWWLSVYWPRLHRRLWRARRRRSAADR